MSDGPSWSNLGQANDAECPLAFLRFGNTLVNEEMAAECRIQQLVEALTRYRRHCSFDEVRSAFQEASAEFAPLLSTKAIEKLLADPACDRAVAAEARYPKELEVLYEGVGELLRVLSAFVQAWRDCQ